jgi:predicted regulator of Ras-like GTPase activity (Roadblock/LC7/MglB family)
MTEPLAEMLKSLRDVEGVIGSLVWAKGGGLLARDLPAYLDPSVLIEVGPRLGRLYEAFESAGDELDSATLVFAEHKLHLRELEPAFVAVLSSVAVNMPALKMALSVVGRRLSAAIEQASAVAAVPGSVASPAATAPAAAKAPPSRFYRGNRLPE